MKFFFSDRPQFVARLTRFWPRAGGVWGMGVRDWRVGVLLLVLVVVRPADERASNPIIF